MVCVVFYVYTILLYFALGWSKMLTLKTKLINSNEKKLAQLIITLEFEIDWRFWIQVGWIYQMAWHEDDNVKVTLLNTSYSFVFPTAI